MPYFPMYIDIQGVLCLVAGGGEIAHRKVMVLRDGVYRMPDSAGIVRNH